MTTIQLDIFFGRWDEAACRLKRLGLTLTVENTVQVPHVQLSSILLDLWSLTAVRVIAGFSVTYDEIYAATREQEQEITE